MLIFWSIWETVYTDDDSDYVFDKNGEEENEIVAESVDNTVVLIQNVS